MGKKLIVMDSMDCSTFKQATGYNGSEGVLRITAKQCGAYDAETNRYYPIPHLLEVLRAEGRITPAQPPVKKEEQKPQYLTDDKQPTSDETPSNDLESHIKTSIKAITAFHRLEDEIEALDGKVRQALHLCSKDTSLSNTQQPSKGDVITYFRTEKDPSPAGFLGYWKSKIPLPKKDILKFT